MTHISLVPTQLVRLLDAGPVVAPHLRGLLLGGAPIPVELVERALAADLPVVTTYGLTEAASGVTAQDPAETRSHPASSGRALPGSHVRILGDDGTVAPVGTMGDIGVSGPALFQGYDGDPDGTDAVLSGGWLRTGDLGIMDTEGRLTVLDRRVDLIISGGENISPVEVETVLRSHPDVSDAAVIGRPDPLWGAVPVAAVVTRADPALVDAAAIADFCRARLASYKVPVSIEVVGAIPRTASGKIVRHALRRTIEAGAADLFVDRPDGARIHVRRRGHGPVVVLLHATLSNATELDPLAIELSRVRTVLAIDRRSAGSSVMPPEDVPGPIDVRIHLEDILAVLDALTLGGPVLVAGHSFGGCVGLELAARHPERVEGAFLFEPPYLAVLPDIAEEPTVLGQRIAGIAERDGLGAAALAFLETVNGPGITRRLPPAVIAQFEREGRSAVADAPLVGLDPTGLADVRAPVVVGLGGRSRGPYETVATGLAARIATLDVERFPALGHGGPVSQPAAVADAIMSFAGRIGHVGSTAAAPGGTA